MNNITSVFKGLSTTCMHESKPCTHKGHEHRVSKAFDTSAIGIDTSSD